MKIVVEYLDGTKEESIDGSDITWDDFKKMMLDNGQIHTLAFDTPSGPVIIPVSSIKKVYPG